MPWITSTFPPEGAGAAWQFCEVRHFAGPLSITHQGQFPASTISFNLSSGYSLGEAVAQIAEAEREIGMPASVHGSFTGTAQAFQESTANQPFLIAAALLAVYIVLGILYESLIHPITILSTLPSAGVGALLALLLFDMDLSIMGLIGIILLIGIVKKNAILMIDFALAAERLEGKRPHDAIFQACVLRFRPILMTTMAALLGAMPLALGTGSGAELRRPLGITIIGGLIFSQALTLYTTPVIYLYLDRLAIRFGGGAASCRLRAKYEAHLSRRFSFLSFHFRMFSPSEIHSSAAPVPPAFKEAPPNNFKESDLFKTAAPQDDKLGGNWWELFSDPVLNELASQVNISNQQIAAAEAQFRSARAAIRVSRSGLFPAVTVTPAATTGGGVNRSVFGTSGGSVATGTSTGTFYTIPFDLTYEVDAWGRIRRSVDAAVATAQASAADLGTIRLSMQSELALDYFQLRGLDEEQRLFQQTVAGYAQALELTTNRYNEGVASQVDLEQARTQLETARAQLIDLGIQRAALEHAIAILIGKPPADLTLPAAPSRASRRQFP
jgi:hypothetical protein